MKRILRKSTETDQHAVFLFTDSQVVITTLLHLSLYFHLTDLSHITYYMSHVQIKQESFLEDINNLLNAGEVPNLYPADEKQEICEKMRQIDRYVYYSHPTPVVCLLFQCITVNVVCVFTTGNETSLSRPMAHPWLCSTCLYSVVVTSYILCSP